MICKTGVHISAVSNSMKHSLESYTTVGNLHEEFDIFFTSGNYEVQRINRNSARVICNSLSGCQLECNATIDKFLVFKLDGGWMKPLTGEVASSARIDRISGAIIETEAGLLSLQTENTPYNTGSFLSFQKNVFCISTAPGSAPGNYAAVIVSRVEESQLPTVFSDLQTYLVPSIGSGFLGYCTWNGIGLDVSSNGVLSALSTLTNVGASPGWIVLDDGWQKFNGSRQLVDNVPSKDKFPGGLKNFISKVKQDFGVRSVFIWTAVTGYWEGVTTQFAESKGVEVVKDQHGRLIFAPTTGGVFKYYEMFFRYLSNEGVAGVKCDVLQNIEAVEVPDFSTNEFYNAYREAMTISAARNNLELIWCGGMVPWVLQRGPLGPQFPAWTSSCAFRNSDDFFPNVYDSHLWHIYCNFLNSLYTRQFGCPLDFDMFQTTLDPPFSRLHAAARIMSGGPMYITDEANRHDSSIFSEFILTGGKVPYFYGPPFITNPLNPFGAGLLEVQQAWGDSKVIALFNLESSGENPIPISPRTPSGYVSRPYNNHKTLTSGMFELITHTRPFRVGKMGDAVIFGYVDKMAGITAVMNYKVLADPIRLEIDLSAGNGILGIRWPGKSINAYMSGQDRKISIDFDDDGTALIKVPHSDRPKIYVQ